MTNQTPPSVQLVLCDKEGLGKITVGLEPFFDFSFEMAEQLQDLVAQWKHDRRMRQVAERCAAGRLR